MGDWEKGHNLVQHSPLYSSHKDISAIHRERWRGVAAETADSCSSSSRDRIWRRPSDSGAISPNARPIYGRMVIVNMFGFRMVFISTGTGWGQLTRTSLSGVRVYVASLSCQVIIGHMSIVINTLCMFVWFWSRYAITDNYFWFIQITW